MGPKEYRKSKRILKQLLLRNSSENKTCSFDIQLFFALKARASFYEFEIYRVGYTYAIFRKQLSEHAVPQGTGTEGIWYFITVGKPRFAHGGLYLYFTHLLCKDKLETKTYKGQGSWKQTGLVLQTNYIVYQRKSSKILL